MAFMRSKYLKGDMRAWLFEEPWQVDWLRATALMVGYIERTNGNFLSTLYHPETRVLSTVHDEMVIDNRGELCVYLQDTLPNITVDVDALIFLISDTRKRGFFIEGRKDEFFADSPA